MERIGGYKICNRHGPYSEPSCQLCQDEMNQRFRRAADQVSQKHTGKAEDTMKQPTREQLNDPDWWEENAPEDATHFDIGDGEPDAWMREVNGSWFAWFEGGWSGYLATQDEIESDFVSRPTKPSAPQWDGEGYPPARCECECLTSEGWERGLSVGPYLDGWLCILSNGRESVFISNGDGFFRPIRTQAEREREDLAKALLTADESMPVDRAKEVADAIIAAGWRKPEGE